MGKDLNSLYEEHKNRGHQAAQFMSSIASAVYAKPHHFGFQNPDEVGEAFATYWTRILGVVDRYRETGSCFDAYLATTLRYIAASMRRATVRHLEEQRVLCDTLAQEATSECAAGLELESNQRTMITPSLGKSRPRRVNQKVLSQRIMFLCAKSALQIKDEEIITIANAIGCNFEDLLPRINQVRTLAGKVHARRQTRIENRNRSWMRVQLYRRQLAYETDPAKRLRLAEGLARQENLHRVALRELSDLKQSISNCQIAKIFGVSKSTVDSGLDRLRQMYQADQAGQQYCAGKGLPGQSAETGD
jgi:hypothetical protein